MGVQLQIKIYYNSDVFPPTLQISLASVHSPLTLNLYECEYFDDPGQICDPASQLTDIMLAFLCKLTCLSSLVLEGCPALTHVGVREHMGKSSTLTSLRLHSGHCNAENAV